MCKALLHQSSLPQIHTLQQPDKIPLNTARLFKKTQICAFYYLYSAKKKKKSKLSINLSNKFLPIRKKLIIYIYILHVCFKSKDSVYQIHDQGQTFDSSLQRQTHQSSLDYSRVMTSFSPVCLDCSTVCMGPWRMWKASSVRSALRLLTHHVS